MARKLKKGYFVRGQFVAEGSERDLELKRELKGGDAPSRTELKRESDAAQKLGEDLVELRLELRTRLGLPERLIEALDEAKRITDFEGRRRHMQFIGKLMRHLDAGTHEAIRDALNEQHQPGRETVALLHAAEQWRSRMLDSDEAIGQWLGDHPDTDSQQLRALVRQARKDARPEMPGHAPRHGRAYREIFQLLHQALNPDAENAD